jgi:hypothetical protein
VEIWVNCEPMDINSILVLWGNTRHLAQGQLSMALWERPSARVIDRKCQG